VFIVSAVALAGLASLVGDGTDQLLGHRMGPAGAGVLQSALGSLPELFISILPCKAGWCWLCRWRSSAILANSPQRFGAGLSAGRESGVLARHRPVDLHAAVTR